MKNKEINYNYKNLSPFKFYVLQNFPFIEADFDALTNYELMCKLAESINKVIDTTNLTGEQLENLTNAFSEVLRYIDEYFDNLDVQEEINNKLDSMAETGELGLILDKYVRPMFNNFTNEINETLVTYQRGVNNQVSDLTNLVNNSISGTPIFVASVDEMTDNTKNYVLSSDGHIYSYNGASFQDTGYVYGNTLENNSVQPINISTNFNGMNDIVPIIEKAIMNDNNVPTIIPYENGERTVNFNMSEGTIGSVSNLTFAWFKLQDAFRPTIINGKINKKMSVIININCNTSGEIHGMFSGTTDFSQSFGDRRLKNGLNYIEFDTDEDYESVLNNRTGIYFAIYTTTKPTIFEGNITIYNNINEVYKKSFEDLTPLSLGNNFNGIYDMIPIIQKFVMNNNFYPQNITNYENGSNTVEFDLNDEPLGTGVNLTFAWFKLQDVFRPVVENGKLNKKISVLIDIDTDTTGVIQCGFSQDTDINENGLTFKNLINGLNYVEFGEEEISSNGEGRIGIYFTIFTDVKPSVFKGKVTLINNENYVMKKLIEENQDITIYNKFIGDSLTELNYSQYINKPNKVNFGYSGEGIESIYERCGINPLYVLSDSISSGTQNIVLSDDIFQIQVGNINPVTIAGIKGNLGKNENGITFTPTESIETTPIFKPLVITNCANLIGNNIVWVGTNNMLVYNASQIYKEWKKALEINPESLIIGLTWDADSTKLNLIHELDNLAKELGTRYIPLHDMIVQYGMSFNNLTPTEEDTAYINNGQIPPSLRTDAVHFNDYGKRYIAYVVEQYMDLLNM